MHVPIIFLLFVPFVLFFIKKLVAIKDGRTCFSGLQYSVAKKEGRSLVMFLPGGGGGTSLWVRRGCAPVLGSFWPENSGIWVSFYWKISVIGVYFHSEFSGIEVTQNSVMGVE